MEVSFYFDFAALKLELNTDRKRTIFSIAVLGVEDVTTIKLCIYALRVWLNDIRTS